MGASLSKEIRRKIRHSRIMAKIKGSKDRPRLFVFRSNRHIYASLIDDQKHHTLFQVSDLLVPLRTKKKIEISRELGRLIARKALEMGIKKIVFDRGGYKYHGNIKALAEGAREAGLQF